MCSAWVRLKVYIVKISHVNPMQNILFCAYVYHFLHMHTHFLLYGPAIHFNANPQNAQYL